MPPAAVVSAAVTVVTAQPKLKRAGRAITFGGNDGTVLDDYRQYKTGGDVWQ